MSDYEYTTIDIFIQDNPLDEINDFAKDGWELVSTYTYLPRGVFSDNKLKLIFKRIPRS